MKKYAIELAWLTAIFVTAYLVATLYVGNATLDIQYHDTYNFYGGSIKATLTGSMFLMLSLLVYLIRSILHQFRQPLVNWIVLIINGLVGYIVVALTMRLYVAKANTDQLRSTLTKTSGGLNTAFYSFLIASILLLALELFVAYRLYWTVREAKRTNTFS